MVNRIYKGALMFVIVNMVSSEYILKQERYLCKSHADCRPHIRDKRLENCTVCADTPSGKSCVFPFPYMFQSGNLRCDVLDPCPVDCPNGHELCNNAYIPTCSCNAPFFGSECQHEAVSQLPVEYVTWRFKGFVPACHIEKLNFIFGSHKNVSDHMNTILLLNTSDGYMIQKSGWEEVPGKCYFRSDYCTMLPLPVKFPYKMFSHTHNNNPTSFITLDDQIIGYYANFSIKIIDLGKLIYLKQFQIIVSYENATLKCISSIQLSNCGQSATSPTIFTRPNGIDFVSKITYVTDGGNISTSVPDEKCAEGNNFSWKLWSYTYVEDTRPPLFENYTNPHWRFNPYSLNIGVYKVLFEVLNVQSNTTNFAYCHFRVKGLPLNVRVEGGSDRMITKNAGVTLSVARSFDPNVPASNQRDLFVEWSCTRIEPPTDFDPICKHIFMSAATPYFISPKMLMYSAVYNFTLMLWSSLYTTCPECGVHPQIRYVRIQVGNETTNKSISIECVENCDYIVNPNEPLFLKVTSKNINVTEANFEWTYSNNSQTVHSLQRMKDLPPFMLLLDEGFLISKGEYAITARDYSEGAYATYEFVVDNIFYDKECMIEPQKGTKGLTEFDIACPLMGDSALMYEFYDKNYNETISKLSFNGRMLGTTSTGQLQHVQLSRGYVTVLIINSRGFSIKQEIKVELDDLNITANIITDLKKNLTDSLIYFSNEGEVVRLASLITDILPTKDKNDFKFLLQNLSKITINTFPRIKLLSSTLYIVLTGFNSDNNFKLHIDLLIDSIAFMGKLTRLFRHFVFNRGSSQYTPSKVIKEIAEIILQCASILIKCKENKTVDVYQEELSLVEKYELRHGSYIIENIIDSIKDVLSLIQYPGKPPLKISTINDDMKIWAVTNDINYPLSSFLKRENDIPVNIPIVLMNSLSNMTKRFAELSLQFAYISDRNIAWLKTDVKSNFVSVSIAKRKRKEEDFSYIESLQYPITIRMTMDDDLQNIKVEDSVIQADTSLHQDYLDLCVKIHRLDIRPRSHMAIIFNYPPTNGSLRVSVMEEYRPDFNHIIKHAVSISNESVIYPHRYHPYDNPRFLYMGIIPGEDVSVNQTVKYSFEVNTTLCQYWSRNSWKSDGCLIHYTQGKTVSCQCTHLTTFGAAFFVPPQQVDPLGDAKLFLTVLDNPFVVVLVVALLLAYFILCIYLRRADKKDKLRKCVVVLQDNFPYDKHPYLLAVFTSPRLNAGTTANVGVKLIGSEAESRAHVLTSDKRRVLKTGSDDWFLIQCPRHLGSIRYISLWHDNSGWSPNWYCENIFVYDLTNKTETKFIVEQWLELSVSKKIRCFPEARVLPSGVEDISSVKRNFLHNVVLGIRDGHRLLRVFYRHPRSQISRVQRLSIVTLYILIAMLCSIMFYIPDEMKEGMDDYTYTVGKKELIISIQSLIISALLTWAVLFAFKKSVQSNPQNEGIRRSILSSKHTLNRPKQTAYSNFVRQISPILKNPPLDPVQLPNTPQATKQRHFWYIIAWVSCITLILLCAFFLMLYGPKLGSVNSKKWLSSVLLALGEDALITAPAKIILFALGLSLTFQLFVDVNTYQINLEDVLYQRNLLEDNDYVKVLNIRKHKMYAPLSRKARLQILLRKQLWSDWWSFVEFIIAVTFVIVTCNVIYVLWSSYYYTNNHIREMIAETKYPVLHSIRFYDVSNITKLEDYLGITLINVLFNSIWYNRRTFNENSFVQYNYLTSDYTNKIFGCIKIRQLRTEPVPCINTKMKSGLCIPKWKESSEDTNIYSTGWKPASYVDVQNKDSYWVYRDQSSLFRPTSVRLYGPSGRLYHDGGYSVILGPTPQGSEQILDELNEYGWQDRNTRVVFVEFTTYNGNQAMFSQVTLIAEYLITGNVLLKCQVISVSSIYEVNVWDCLFVCYIIFQCLKTVYLVSYYGLLDFLSHSGIYNITRMFDIILGILSITLFFIHFYLAAQYTDELRKSGYDKYFEFDSFFQYFVLLQISLSILVSISIIRVFGSIRGGKSVIIHFNTFTSSMKFLYCMIILPLLVFIVLTQWTLILDFTLFSFKEMFINEKSFIHVTNQELQYNSTRLFIVVKMLTIYLINAMFLMMLVYTTRISKTFKSNISQRFNFVTFIMTRCVNRCNKIISR